MAKDGLLASVNSGWIDRSDYRIDSFTVEMFENFVLGTPSVDISEKGRDLYTVYSLIEPSSYKLLWKKLTDGISECLIGKSAKEVKELINKSTILNYSTIPAKLTEAICIQVPEAYQADELYRKHFLTLPAISSKGKNNIDRHKDAEERRTVSYVNRLFRHIRNSLAHGRFAIADSEGDEYYILQDVSNQGEVSARMIIRQSRLKEWMSLLKQNNLLAEIETAELLYENEESTSNQSQEVVKHQ